MTAAGRICNASCTRPQTEHLRSSPIQRYWEQDEPPASYYQQSEGTLEYDRRKLVGTSQFLPKFSAHHSP